jgi:hypothetical protein
MSATTNAMSHLLFDGAHERRFHTVRKALHSYSRAMCARPTRRSALSAADPQRAAPFLLCATQFTASPQHYRAMTNGRLTHASAVAPCARRILTFL